MDITFDIPHYFSPQSTAAEKKEIADVLKSCLSDFQKRSPKGIFTRKPSLVQTASTQVTFALPGSFTLVSSAIRNSQDLRALLDCLSSINAIYLKYRPGQVVPLYLTPVYYRRTIVWDSTPALYARGYGDCKSLACAQEAEYRNQRIPCETQFRYDPPNDQRDFMLFHILLITPYGSTMFEDPSKVKGMGGDENAHANVT